MTLLLIMRSDDSESLFGKSFSGNATSSVRCGIAELVDNLLSTNCGLRSRVEIIQDA